jgi:hypothetical protein
VPSRSKLVAALLGAVVVVGAGATAGIAEPTGNNTMRPLKINQTEGYFEGQVQVFTYAQNFFCTIEAFDDLDGIDRNGDGVPSSGDPDEMILPECVSGETEGGSLPMMDPTGKPLSESRLFFAIVPVFDADGDRIPETFDPDPGVDLQCPEPGPPFTEEDQPVGSCTTHPSLITADPILAEGLSAVTGFEVPEVPTSLGGFPGPSPVDSPVLIPTAAPNLLPLPGHSHIIETENDPTIWWQVIVNLVEDPSVWPTFDGDCPAGRDRCLTSLEALRASQADGGTGRDIPTNIWLFFANEPLQHGGAPAGETGGAGTGGAAQNNFQNNAQNKAENAENKAGHAGHN